MSYFEQLRQSVRETRLSVPEARKKSIMALLSGLGYLLYCGVLFLYPVSFGYLVIVKHRPLEFLGIFLSIAGVLGGALLLAVKVIPAGYTAYLYSQKASQHSRLMVRISLLVKR